MITQKQRDTYRYALEDKGVPEVIAFMAAQVGDCIANIQPGETAVELIGGGIWWSKTPQGYEFWEIVFANCELLK